MTIQNLDDNSENNPEKMERPRPWPDPPDQGISKNIDQSTAKNTDKELWRQNPDDFLSPSIHVTKEGKIGIDVGGHVLVAPVEHWHKAGVTLFLKLFER